MNILSRRWAGPAALMLFGFALAACNTTDSQYKDVPVDQWPSQQTIRSLGKGD
ncbi:hypothetical protein [Acuticoccus kandeliae]|uniref:hypothetical protein n=1 Tax=Acuticoccus kandeliae TaxID=2073160 RepID=UPI001300174C|nr:hypothetical protein [Acuticoccus kandeliae]